MKVIAFYDNEMEDCDGFTNKVIGISADYPEVECMLLETKSNPELVNRYSVKKLPTIIVEDKAILKRRFEEDVSVTEIVKHFTQK